MAASTRKKAKTKPSREESFGAAIPVAIETTVGSAPTSRTFRKRDSVDASLAARFPNLLKTPSPFRTSANNEFIDTREAVSLCIQAYWAFPLLRNMVEIMGELANSDIILNGGSASSRGFLTAWFDKIGLWKLKEQFFREWFRSGNFFAYRSDATLSEQSLNKMTQTFGAVESTIPVRYSVLNPEQIKAAGAVSLGQSIYYKVNTPYEKKQLSEAKTRKDAPSLQDLQIDLFPASATDQLLDAEKLSVVLYKAQGYEPMGVPMAYGVLDDIEAKLELKRIDLSIARTIDRALLLITVGEKPSEYNRTPVNKDAYAALQKIFESESVARTLVADYTVKGEWLIPDTNKILGEQKYAQIDKDIKMGLNAIFFDTDEKFANASIKVQVFIERLQEARQAFLTGFLQKEIVRVCKAIGAKNYPTAEFEENSLRDELQWSKLALTMAQFGFLTPDELQEALKTGRMPSKEESRASQEEFAQLRKQGMYLPISGGSTEIQMQQLELQKVTAAAAKTVPSGSSGAAGRPSGSSAPKASSSPSPIGTAKASIGFSLTKLKDLFWKVTDLQNRVDGAIARKFGVTVGAMDDKQKDASKSLTLSIITNEPDEAWGSCLKHYLKTLPDVPANVLSEVESLAAEHDIPLYEAAILRLAKTSAP